MQGPHPIQVVTLLVVLVTAALALGALRTAREARDLAAAAAAPDGDDSADILALQDALVRAGVIRDPWDIRDDAGELGGPWARCLTEEERRALDGEGSHPPVGAPCGTVTVESIECPEPAPPPPPPSDDPEAATTEYVVEGCPDAYAIDGRRHELIGLVHPEDVTAVATTWLRAEGEPGIDRVARGAGRTFVHTRDGWAEAYAT